MFLTLSRGALFGLTLLGGWSLHVFNNNNGFFDLIKRSAKAGILSDKTPYSATFTNVEGLDNLLNLLLQFFWPAVDGNHPDLSLASAWFVGQGVSVWVLIMLEGKRRGNLGKLVSYIITTGVLFQTLGLAVVGPLYLLVHLSTVRRVSSPTPEDLSISNSELTALPISFAVGLVAPTVFMALPSPSLLAVHSKIAGILLWQAFPIWTILIQSVLVRTVLASNTPPSKLVHLASLRRVYKFALYLSTAAHLGTFTLCVSTLLFPGILSETARSHFLPQHLFVPSNPFSDVVVSSIAQGSFWFIQWDYTIAGTAFVVWGLCQKYGGKQIPLGDILYDGLVRPVLFGPMGAALVYVWERDEEVLEKTVQASEKKLQ